MHFDCRYCFISNLSERLFSIIVIGYNYYNYKINNEKIITKRFTFCTLTTIIRIKAETKHTDQ